MTNIVSFLIAALLLTACGSSSETKESGTITTSERVETKTFSAVECYPDNDGELILTVPFPGKTKAELEQKIVVEVVLQGIVGYTTYQAQDSLIWFHCGNDGLSLEQRVGYYNYNVILLR